MVSKERLAYQAGLFDGEGSIYMTGREVGSTITVTLTNTNWQLCQIFVEAWGGKISKQVPKNMERAKEVYRWYRSGKRAVPFLEAIMPYLVAKKNLAKLSLRYIALQVKSGNRYPIDILSQREQLAQAIYNAQPKQRLL